MPSAGMEITWTLMTIKEYFFGHYHLLEMIMYTFNILHKFIKNIILTSLLTSQYVHGISIHARPYIIYNTYSLTTRIIPHVAIEVRTCTEKTCSSTTYGLVGNSKVYSPDILTVGAKCSDYLTTCKKCKPCRKNILPGFGKQYLTEWISIKNTTGFVEGLTRRMIYNPLFENGASFVASVMRKGGSDFTCVWLLGIDTPYTCG